jgi:hypothetical protein
MSVRGRWVGRVGTIVYGDFDYYFKKKMLRRGEIGIVVNEALSSCPNSKTTESIVRISYKNKQGMSQSYVTFEPADTICVEGHSINNIL